MSTLLVRKTTSAEKPPSSDHHDKKLAMANTSNHIICRPDSSLDKEEQPSSFAITTELHLVKTSDLDRDVVLKRIRRHKFRRSWLNHRSSSSQSEQQWLDPDDAFSSP